MGYLYQDYGRVFLYITAALMLANVMISILSFEEGSTITQRAVVQ